VASGESGIRGEWPSGESGTAVPAVNLGGDHRATMTQSTGDAAGAIDRPCIATRWLP